jgi:hypothetical protein
MESYASFETECASCEALSSLCRAWLRDAMDAMTRKAKWESKGDLRQGSETLESSEGSL